MTCTEMQGVRLFDLRGEAIRGCLDAVGALRLSVFAQWPYLYRGTPEEERAYLAAMASSPDALCVLAEDAASGRVVGASTAMPLSDEHAAFREPFERGEAATGIAASSVFYLAESVLLPEYRGRGVGKAFFERREAHARRLDGERRAQGRPGFTHLAFCAVDRPDDHPLRPADYRPLDGFWRSRGYERRPDLVAHFTWRDIDRDDETTKPLTFWIKALPVGVRSTS